MRTKTAEILNSSAHSTYDILALTETWLNDTNLSMSLCLIDI